MNNNNNNSSPNKPINTTPSPVRANAMKLEKTKKLLNEFSPIYEIEEKKTPKNLYARLDEDLTRAKEQINKKKRLAHSYTKDIKKNEQGSDIINFKRKMGLLYQDTQEKFKENMKIFSIVDTFIDIREKLEKASQLDKIEQFLRQKNLLEERRKQKNLNLFSKKEYVELDHFEAKEEDDEKNKLILDNDYEARIYRTDLLSKTNEILDKRIKKVKSSSDQNGEDPKSEKTSTLMEIHDGNIANENKKDKIYNNMKAFSMSNIHDPKALLSHKNNLPNYEFTNNERFTNNKRLTLSKPETINKQVYEHLKKDKYKFPLISEDENPFDFYEKIESGEVFRDKSPPKIRKAVSENRYIDFQSLDKDSKVVNPFDTNMIFQDIQYVLINNLENYHLNSKKLVQDTKFKSRYIYKFGKKSKRDKNIPQSNENTSRRVSPMLASSSAAITTEDFAKNKHNNNKGSENEFDNADTERVFIIDRKFSDIATPVQETSVVDDQTLKTIHTPTNKKNRSSLKESNSNLNYKRQRTQLSVEPYNASEHQGKQTQENDLRGYKAKTPRDIYSRKSFYDADSKIYSNTGLNFDNRSEEPYIKKTEYNDNNTFYKNKFQRFDSKSYINQKYIDTVRSKIKKGSPNPFSDKLMENKTLYRFKSMNTNFSKTSPKMALSLLPSIIMKNAYETHDVFNNTKYPNGLIIDKKNKRKSLLYEEANNINQLINNIEEVTKQNQIEKKEIAKTRVVLSQSFEKNKQRANRLMTNVFDVQGSDFISNNKQNLIKLQKILSTSIHNDS